MPKASSLKEEGTGGDSNTISRGKGGGGCSAAYLLGEIFECLSFLKTWLH